MSDVRVVFARSRPGVLWGMTAAQLVVLGVALLLLITTLKGGATWPWTLAAALLAGVFVLLRYRGRPLAGVAPALAVEAVMRLTGQHVYRGGPVRTTKPDTQVTGEPLNLPGALSKLTVESFSVGVDEPPIALVRDRTDGSITVVLAVVGLGIVGANDGDLVEKSVAFQQVLDGLARGSAPVTCIQLLHRVIPDEGDEVWRQLRNRGDGSVRFAGSAYRSLLSAVGGTGIRHQSYVVLRLNPRRDAAKIKEFGGGAGAEASLAVETVGGLRRDLRACGVEVTGWLPARAVAAVIRSAFDPSSERMITRRGGGTGDSEGGDAGLPSGVDPAQAGPMMAARAMTYYAHNDHYSRSWWVQNWPRSRSGVVVGFLQPLLLGLPYRHSVSIILRPVPYRQAMRGVNKAVASSDTRTFLNRKVRGRVTREDQREAQDIDRRELELVEGYAVYQVAGMVSVTARSREELESATADVESALNECSLEAQRWIIETDQAFAMAALPLARGLV